MGDTVLVLLGVVSSQDVQQHLFSSHCKGTWEQTGDSVQQIVTTPMVRKHCDQNSGFITFTEFIRETCHDQKARHSILSVVVRYDPLTHLSLCQGDR